MHGLVSSRWRLSSIDDSCYLSTVHLVALASQWLVALRFLRGLCLDRASELDKALEAFSMAIASAPQDEGLLPPDSEEGGDCGGFNVNMQAAFLRQRGKIRHLLRDFEGARRVLRREHSVSLGYIPNWPTRHRRC